MPDFDFSTLITDRSPADLELLRDMLATPLEDWTAEQLAEFNLAVSKGTYNYTDLNRVTACMDYLNEQLTALGYDTGYLEIETGPGRTEWEEPDTPTSKPMGTYLANLQALRSSLKVLTTTPETPESMAALTWTCANNIEQILIDIESVIDRVFTALARSNSFTFWSGNRPFPTRYSNLGRTWKELDEMNTTWANWAAASWYLLLYGNLEAEGASI